MKPIAFAFAWLFLGGFGTCCMAQTEDHQLPVDWTDRIGARWKVADTFRG
jgi:hypothetical protein